MPDEHNCKEKSDFQRLLRGIDGVCELDRRANSQAWELGIEEGMITRDVFIAIA